MPNRTIDVCGNIGSLDTRSATPQQLNTFAESCAIDIILFANLDAAAEGNGAEETQANLAALEVRRDFKRLVPMYWVRPGRFDSNIHAFAGAIDAEPFAAALFAPRLGRFQADADILDPYLSVLARLHKPAVFRTDPDADARPACVYRVAQRHPGVPIVLCAASRDTHLREAVEYVERATQRRDARLYLATAHMNQDEVADAIGRIGEDHVLFASDAPQGPDHDQATRDHLEAMRNALSTEQYAAYTGQNAERIFHIPTR